MSRTPSTSSQPTDIPSSQTNNLAPCHNKAKAPCRLCYRAVGDKGKSILCDYCNNWCHQGCTNLADDTFKALAESNQKFFCSLCMPIINNFLAIEKRIDSFESRMANFEDRLAKLENAKPRPPPLMNYTTPDAPLLAPNPNDFRAKLRDELERESKRKNAVLFGLESSGANDTDTVKKLIAEADLDDSKPEDVVTVFRDGPTYQDKPRFCKVYLNSVDSKIAFIKFINESRKSNDPIFSNMRSRPDLSYFQRKKGRELRSELKSRTDSGEANLFIDYKSETIKPRRRVI